MKTLIIKKLLEIILATASEVIIKAIAEAIIDVVRAKVIESENQIDDMIVLPLLDKVEDAFELDDDDG